MSFPEKLSSRTPSIDTFSITTFFQCVFRAPLFNKEKVCQSSVHIKSESRTHDRHADQHYESTAHCPCRGSSVGYEMEWLLLRRGPGRHDRHSWARRAFGEHALPAGTLGQRRQVHVHEQVSSSNHLSPPPTGSCLFRPLT